MKKFALHITGLLLAMLLIMTVLDFTYTEVFRSAAPRTKFQFLRSLKHQHFDYVFLGSSRVENGINPIIINEKTGKKSLNLGFPASKMSDILAVLKLLNGYDIKADRVFIQIDYIFNIEEHSNILQYQFIPFVRDNPTTKENLRYLDDFTAVYYVPFYRYSANDYRIGFREFFLNAVGKKGNVVQTQGYSPRFGYSLEADPVALPDDIRQRNPAFEKLYAYCRENKIDVVYFCAPFRKNTKNLGYVKKLQSKVPGLRDYSQLVQNDSLFADGRHLNDNGATFFTNFLITDLHLK